MYVYRKLSDLNPCDRPQVYGPRWTSLEDAPEAIRPLLVEVDGDLPESAVERLPAGVEVEARVGELYGAYLRVRATKETLWDAVRETVAQHPTTLAMRDGQTVAVPALYSQVSVTKVSGEGWTWDFGSDGMSVDPTDYVYIRSSAVIMDDEDDLDLAVLVMTMLRDFKAWFKS